MHRFTRWGRVTGLVALVLLLCAPGAQALTLAYYGDDDGFGIGATSGTVIPTVSHADPTDAPFTDVRLIADGYAAPGFAPTGGFEPFILPSGSVITSATLTLRAGSLVTDSQPLGGPNQLLLDGMAVDPAFFDLFTANSNAGDNNIETVSYTLPPAFYPLLADGSVSLNGTRITENRNAGSFQVDFLRLAITTNADQPAVPEPGALAFGAASVLGLLRLRPRHR